MGRAVAPAIALSVGILAWWGCAWGLEISPLILPTPDIVVHQLFQRWGYLCYHSGVTILEAALGLLAGSSAGFLLASIFLFLPPLKDALYPYAIAFKAVPLVALAPLVVVWCGGGIESKIVLAAAICFFPVLVNAYAGLAAANPEAVDLMAAMSASNGQVFWKLRVPYALPMIFSALRVASTFAVVGAVVAEFVGAEAGIGYVIKSASYYLDTGLMFAAIIMAALAGLLFFGVVVAIELAVLKWRPQQ